ncbi:hypothetical protein ACEPAI_1679 [Sanghuangporus weigelae]
MSDLQLMCLVLGDPHCVPFMARIAPEQPVGFLKQTIYEMNRQYFIKAKVDAASLMLYFVRPSCPPDLSDVIDETFLSRARDVMDYSLLPKDNAVLSAVISRTENGKIHVLVDNHRKRFGKHTNWQIEEAFSDTLIDEPSLGENLSGTVKSRHSKTISLVKDASSPSTAADPANIQSQQSNFPIYNGRPDKFRGPPITIYNEAFARLKDDIDNLGDIIPTSTELEITFDLFKEAVKFYSVEPERTKVMFKLLEQFFDCPIRKEIRTLNSIGDGVIETETNANGWFAAIAWFELKNEIGSKGDAQYQAVCTYRKHVASDMYAKIRASTCCPCLIVSFMGPFMSIQGAIFIDAPIVQPFTEFFFLGGDPDYELRVLKIARILHATKNAIACIRRHYQQVELSATVNPEALLPCPVVIERPNPFPRIAFMDRLFKTIIKKMNDNHPDQQESLNLGALLIDFDWCGKNMESRYPATLNTTVDWAPGVLPFGTMEKEHDEYQLAKLQVRSI